VKKGLAILCLTAFAATSPAPPEFRNVARQAGLTDVFPNGGDASKKYILETTGSGVAFIDYDNDGLPDIFVVSGAGATNRMYHNEGNGKFRDVTQPSDSSILVGARGSARAITTTTALPICS